MKKLVFGCALMLSGIIGSIGWIIACVSLVQGGAWSTVFNLFRFDRRETYIIILFFAVAVAGLVISVRALKDDK